MKAPTQRQIVLWAALAVGCGGAAKKATATIESKSASTVTGTATFTQQGEEVTLKLDIAGAPEGSRGAHIHATGDCSSADGMSAGGHWNPTNENHGAWENAPHHLGDLGNITVGADGKGSISITTNAWQVGNGDAGTNDVVGKAIIIHSGTDDFTTQPTGNAGSRIGCGVIVRQTE